ncbi:MAG: hypothetical protein HY260_09215 [Chloroflexi bacterium]|nr:hypothetical protein [Chloroflexota bacterium]
MALHQTALADKQRVYDLLEELPAESLAEVLYFLEFLRFKATKPKNIVKLGGIWADADLDGVEEELRILRRESLEHLEQEFAETELSL